MIGSTKMWLEHFSSADSRQGSTTLLVLLKSLLQVILLMILVLLACSMGQPGSQISHLPTLTRTPLRALIPTGLRRLLLQGLKMPLLTSLLVNPVAPTID